MKASIKNTNLPYRGEPTKAVYKKPVVGDVSKYLRVELPCQYNPRPAPIPKLRKKRKAVQPKSNDRKRAVHRKPSFWTEERVSLLIDLHSQGLIYADIAVRMGTTKCAITSEVNRLVEQGILEPRNCGNQWNQDDIDRLVELRNEGKTFGEIADVLGKKQKACWEAWRRWNDKQNCMRELLAGMDHSGKHD